MFDSSGWMCSGLHYDVVFVHRDFPAAGASCLIHQDECVLGCTMMWCLYIGTSQQLVFHVWFIRMNVFWVALWCGVCTSGLPSSWCFMFDSSGWMCSGLHYDVVFVHRDFPAAGVSCLIHQDECVLGCTMMWCLYIGTSQQLVFHVWFIRMNVFWVALWCGVCT